MSEEISSLCATCKNKSKDCKKIKIIQKRKCKIIKCLNYEVDKTKISRYSDFRYKIKSK